MRIQSSLVRSGVLCGLALGAYLVGMRPAAADLTLVESNGWTFFTEGRVNAFLSYGVGDDFPQPTLNPLDPTIVDANGVPVPQLQHNLVGLGQPFTAGYSSFQGDASGKYSGARVRSGFLGSILAFGIRRQVTETTTAKGYISLWGTAESFSRDRVNDSGLSTAKGFDVREGYVAFEGPWGALAAGRQGGLLGSITTESISSTATITGSVFPAWTSITPRAVTSGPGRSGRERRRDSCTGRDPSPG